LAEWLVETPVTDSSLEESKSSIGAAWQSDQRLQLPGLYPVLKEWWAKAVSCFPRPEVIAWKVARCESQGKNAAQPHSSANTAEARLSGKCKKLLAKNSLLKLGMIRRRRGRQEWILDPIWDEHSLGVCHDRTSTFHIARAHCLGTCLSLSVLHLPAV
jgi:hypothetical protein